MSKFSALFAATLITFAGAAHAGVLNGQTAVPGTPTDDWASGWKFGSGASATVMAPGKELDGAFAAQFTGNTDTAATLALAAKATGGISVDFLFQYSGTLGNNDFLGFWLGNSTGPSLGLKANCGTGACTNDVFVRLGGGEGVYLPGSDLEEGATYRLFGYLYKTDGSLAYNNFDAWLNPTDYEMATLTGADAHAAVGVKGSGASTLQSIASVGFRTANLDNGVSVRVDNVDIDTNAVPEPASLALMGLAMVGLGVARRRKQA